MVNLPIIGFGIFLLAVGVVNYKRPDMGIKPFKKAVGAILTIVGLGMILLGVFGPIDLF